MRDSRLVSDLFPSFPIWVEALKPWNFLAVHSGGRAFDLWRCGAWNRRKIFQELDEYEPEFLVEDCGGDVLHPSSNPLCHIWPALKKTISGMASPYIIPSK
jgi:hypothetical protein